MSTPLPPVPKKRGMGCLGCGCAILVILGILFVGLVVGGTYLIYKGLYAVTAPTAATIPTFDGGDALDKTAEDKLTSFNQDLENHQPGSLHLTADEMNTLIARDANFSGNNIHLFLTVNDNEAHALFSGPTSLFPGGDALFKGRYVNIDGTLGLDFDADTRNVHLVFHSLALGDKTIPEAELPLVRQELDPVLNAELQKNPLLTKILNRATTITIKDSEFIIETE